MKNILIIFGIILFGVLILFMVFRGGNSPQQANLNQIYSINDEEKPALAVEPNGMVQDLGNMKVSEERAAEFEIRNNGLQPLTIFNSQTSCMCTFGQIIIGENKSPTFSMSMHGNPKWQGILEPGQTAVAKVIYRPYLMPVQGPVERAFIFETNDPSNPKVYLTIKAFVEQ
ncbi:MAG: DUF1573 domain-containing protein [Candidatus Nealsonbacteria bacterium]|nr:DUF1573 domain-containing protein [Candidatus Nealsonbacteria bacterium]